MAISKSYSEIDDCAAMQLPKKKPVDVARHALHSAASLADRVEKMVKYLIGEAPATICGEMGESPEVEGTLPSLADHASRTERIIRDAHEALNRLDSAI